MTSVEPAETAAFIEDLSQTVYRQSHEAGGSIPYTVIREVAENFIHARFAEATVSILDGGNTIRFTDQGPGIPDKIRAQQPGFTRAIEPMKFYIRGVGSGLPIVREYMELSHGSITIEDNLGTGAVVTISLVSDSAGDAGAQGAGGPSGVDPYSSVPQPPFPNSGQYVGNPPYPGYSPTAVPAGSSPGQTVVPAYQQAGPPDFAQPARPVYDQMQMGYGQPVAAPAAYDQMQPGYGQLAPASGVYDRTSAGYGQQAPVDGGRYGYGNGVSSASQTYPTPGYGAGFPVAQQPRAFGAAGYPAAPAGFSQTVGASGAAIPLPELDQRERDVLALLRVEGLQRVKDVSDTLGMATSSAHSVLTKLEEKGLVMKVENSKRTLTEIGRRVAQTL